MYGPEPDAQDRRRYEQLIAAQRDAGIRVAALPPETEAADPAAPNSAMRRRRTAVRRAAIPLALLLIVGAVLTVRAVLAATTLPETVTAPSLSGTTLAVLGNERKTNLPHGETSYQPYGYTVFHPDGRSLHIALHCVGVGRVTVLTATEYPFHCAGGDHVLRLDDNTAHEQPFVLFAKSTGDVVWAVRITLRPVELSKRFNSDLGAVPGAGESG